MSKAHLSKRIPLIKVTINLQLHWVKQMIYMSLEIIDWEFTDHVQCCSCEFKLDCSLENANKQFLPLLPLPLPPSLHPSSLHMSLPPSIPPWIANHTQTDQEWWILVQFGHVGTKFFANIKKISFFKCDYLSCNFIYLVG